MHMQRKQKHVSPQSVPQRAGVQLSLELTCMYAIWTAVRQQRKRYSSRTFTTHRWAGMTDGGTCNFIGIGVPGQKKRQPPCARSGNVHVCTEQ